MAEATTGNNLAGINQGTGIVSRISSSISNVRILPIKRDVVAETYRIFDNIFIFVFYLY